MPTNLYGPDDNFSLQTSRVLPASLRKIDDSARLAAQIELEAGIRSTYEWFLNNRGVAKT